MLVFNKFYWRKGVRRKEHFIDPIVVDGASVEFPIQSTLHFMRFPQGDVSKEIPFEYLTKDYAFLKNANDVQVYTVDELTDKSIGKTLNNPSFIPKVYLAESIKKCKEFKFIKPGQTLPLRDKTLKIINYAPLVSKYKYSVNPLKEFFIFSNILNTVIESINKEERYQFLNIDIPFDITDRVMLEKIVHNTNTELIKQPHLKILNDYRKLLLYDLWKLLTPAKRDLSILSRVSKAVEDKLNLLFNIDNKVYIINLKILLSSIKEYSLGNSAIPPLESGMFRKLFYKTLLAIQLKPGMTDSEIDNYDKNLDNVVLEEEPIKEEKEDEDFEDDIEEKEEIEEIEEDEIEDDMDLMENAKKKIKTNVKLKAINSGLSIPGVKDDEVVDMSEVIDTDSVTDATDIETIKNEEVKPDKVLDDLDNLLDSIKSKNMNVDQKAVTTQNIRNIKKIAEKQLSSKEPFGSGKSVREIITLGNDNIDIKEDKGNIITPNKVVFKEDFNSNIINNINKKYINEQYRKDLVRAVHSFQNAGYIISKYEVETDMSIMGGIETHKIAIKTLDNKTHNVTFKLPVIDEKGVMRISGNEYVMRKQKNTSVISKIEYNRVKITTYNGTQFITKAHYKKNDRGYWLMNRIARLEGISNLIINRVKAENTKLPRDYACISRYVLSFKYGDYEFNFNKPVVDKDKISVGKYKDKPMYMDFNDNIISEGKTLGTIPSILELDIKNEPIEYAIMGIKGANTPVVIVLCYYYGLVNLMKTLKVEYSLEEKHRYEEGYFSVKFQDTVLVVKRDYGVADMILGGLEDIEKYTNLVKFDTMKSKNSLVVLLSKMEFRPTQITELKMLEDTFVDPITASLCKELGYPTTFKGLLIKAIELLLDDNYINQSNMANMRLLGYERIAGMVYNQLQSAIKTYETKSQYTKATININPFDVFRKITEDNTTVLIDDLNPIAAMKQTEDVSLLGMFGFGKDSLAQGSRVFDESEVGIISEATKDSSDVGITAYLTASPNITNTRGITEEFDSKKDGHAKLFSTSALLAPFSMNDGPQRLNFISIMNAHIIPISNMRVPYVRTGYEAIIPIRCNDKYVTTAEEDGKITKLTDKELEITYNSGKSKTYKIKDFTTKEENDACYTHRIVPNVKLGDKVGKDDTLLYSTSFFEPDIFNPKRVIYKQGDILTVALTEDLDTFEDSATISSSVYKRLQTEITKAVSRVVEKTDVITNLVKPNQEVEPTTVLFTAIDADVAGGRKLDEKTIEILKTLKSISPKAKIKGVIDKIEVRYNCDINTMSDSLKKIAIDSDKVLKEKTGYTGKVDMGYSIKGKSLLNDQVEIKFYIRAGVDMSSGDKAIMGNQLKFTVGDVYYNTLNAEDGTPIDATFSYRSISARIVNSPILLGTTGMVLEQLTKKACEMYFS